MSTSPARVQCISTWGLQISHRYTNTLFREGSYSLMKMFFAILHLRIYIKKLLLSGHLNVFSALHVKFSACLQRSSLTCGFKDQLSEYCEYPCQNWRTLLITLHIAQEFYQNMQGHSLKSLQNKQISNNWFEQSQFPHRHFRMKHLILRYKGVDTCMISTFRRRESSIFQCLCTETRHINVWW